MLEAFHWLEVYSTARSLHFKKTVYICVTSLLYLFSDWKVVEEALTPGMDKFWKQKWSDGRTSTEILISIMKQERFKKLLHNTSVVKNKFWEVVADEMSKMGAPLPCPTRWSSGRRCHEKWRYLRRQYKQFKEHIEKTGDDSKPPKYFFDVDEVMRADEYVIPVSLVDALDHSVPVSDSTIVVSQNQDMTSEVAGTSLSLSLFSKLCLSV